MFHEHEDVRPDPAQARHGRDEFHDYYRHPHGTMGRNMTTMRGYVQNNQIDTDRLGPGQARFDAVAEIWRDNEADVRTVHEEPSRVKKLIEEEPKVDEMPNTKFLAAETEVSVSGARPNDGPHAGDEGGAPSTPQQW